jgi:NTE family protein
VDGSPVRALILSGGGARGAYEAGVAAALAERLQFDIICGTSIGAVNGFLVAQGMAGQLEALWCEAAERNVAPFRPEVADVIRMWTELHAMVQGSLRARLHDTIALLEGLPGLRALPRLEGLLGFLDSTQMRALVREHARREDLRGALLLAVTNLTNARANTFAHFPSEFRDPERAAAVLARDDIESITDENYVDAICASAALPAAFEPVTASCKNGRRHTFVDGAFTNNTPIRPAVEAGATEIIAISVDPLVSPQVERKVRNIGDVIMLALEANTSQMLQLDLASLQLTNAGVDLGTPPGTRRITLRQVRPNAPLAIEPLDFAEPGMISALVSQGRRDAERTLTEAPAP